MEMAPYPGLQYTKTELNLKSGEYGGKYRISHPCEVIGSSIRTLQCMLALFIMITLRGAGKTLQ
jgi:hypothetical protein